jgi:hypothetical protein
LVPNQSPQNCILPPLKDRLQRSSFFYQNPLLLHKLRCRKTQSKTPRKQTNKAAKILFLKIPSAKSSESFTRSLASSLAKKKKLSQNPLPARAHCFANPKKDHPPKKQKHTDIVQGSEWSVVGFLPTKCATWRDLIGGKT